MELKLFNMRFKESQSNRGANSVRPFQKISEIKKLRESTVQREIDEWAKVANEGSTLVQVLYTTFLILLVVGFTVIYGTTHKQLFLDELITISVGQSIQIPISAFYLLFPIVLVYLHFQLLWQMANSAEKLSQLRNIGDRAAIKEDDPNLRLKLTNLVMLHVLASKGIIHWIASALLFITVALIPSVLIAYAQFQFLPFHSEVITNIQRMLASFDILLTLFFWIKIHSKTKLKSHGHLGSYFEIEAAATVQKKYWWQVAFRRSTVPKTLSLFFKIQLAIASCVFLLLGMIIWGVFTFPGEWVELKQIAVLRRVSPGWLLFVDPNERNKDSYSGEKVKFLWFACEKNHFLARGNMSIGPDDSVVLIARMPELNVSRIPPCFIPKTTFFVTAVFFAPHTGRFRSLSLPGAVLGGEALSSYEVARLAEIHAGTLTESEFKALLGKVEEKRINNRNFDYADLTRARLIKLDLSLSSLNGAFLYFAQAQGSNIHIRSPQRVNQVFLDNLDISGGTLFAKQFFPVNSTEVSGAFAELQFQALNPISEAFSIRLKAQRARNVTFVLGDYGTAPLQRSYCGLCELAQRINVSGDLRMTNVKFVAADDRPGDLSLTGLSLAGSDIGLDPCFRTINREIESKSLNSSGQKHKTLMLDKNRTDARLTKWSINQQKFGRDIPFQPLQLNSMKADFAWFQDPSAPLIGKSVTANYASIPGTRSGQSLLVKAEVVFAAPLGEEKASGRKILPFRDERIFDDFFGSRSWCETVRGATKCQRPSVKQILRLATVFCEVVKSDEIYLQAVELDEQGKAGRNSLGAFGQLADRVGRQELENPALYRAFVRELPMCLSRGKRLKDSDRISKALSGFMQKRKYVN
jgi:hypothetical protein